MQGLASHHCSSRRTHAGRLPRRQLALRRLQLLPRHAERRGDIADGIRHSDGFLRHSGDLLQKCSLLEGTEGISLEDCKPHRSIVFLIGFHYKTGIIFFKYYTRQVIHMQHTLSCFSNGPMGWQTGIDFLIQSANLALSVSYVLHEVFLTSE